VSRAATARKVLPMTKLRLHFILGIWSLSGCALKLLPTSAIGFGLTHLEFWMLIHCIKSSNGKALLQKPKDVKQYFFFFFLFDFDIG
jgi:hypothetical protein